jgi:signal transduction histidine kinase
MKGRPGDGARLGFLRTTAFRVTLLHLGLTLFGTAALAGVVWWATVGYATRQAVQQVERDTGLLLRAGALSGLAGMRLSVEARLASDRSGLDRYLLAAPDGTRLAGNLASAPLQPGWRSLGLEQREAGSAAGGEPAPMIALVTRLPGGGSLVVARDLSPIAQLEERLWAAAGWVGGAALLLGLLGGLLVGRGVARRAAAMGAALEGVQAGDLGRRLPVAGSDEFDRLARRINATLDRLEAVMAALRQVTDDIAHDLRTPLSRLRQRLEGAAGAGSPAEWRQAAETAIAECDAILEIFAALLRIAQVESGAALRQGFGPFDLSAAAEAVAEAYAPAAEERGQAFAAAIAPGIGGFGDRMLVSQMLANLVENAVRHGRAGGRVRLALEAAPDGAAVLTVEDDGPGIPAAERERVFRRFVRLDAARATPGSGLGLALVRAVAGLHGAEVTLGDAGPGLRVRVRFPPRPGQPE